MPKPKSQPQRTPLTSTQKTWAHNLRHEFKEWQIRNRGKRKVTQESVALDLGISPGAVSQYFGEKAGLNIEIILKLAKIFEIEPSKIAPNLNLPASSAMTINIDSISEGFIDVPRFDAVAAMGDGATQQDHDNVVELVRINKQYLARRTSYTNPSNLAIITAVGDSMSPTFNEGDLLIIDTGVTTASSDAVYVISRNGALFIKRVMRLDGETLRVLSDNERYKDHHYDVTPDTSEGFQIHGRVLMAWNAQFM